MNAALRLPVPDAARHLGDRLGRLAARALIREAMLTPKPGLVDRANNGAHDDMDLSTFLVSARAIAPRLPGFFLDGYALAALPAPAALAALRPLGRACERAMLAATGGINTHKGAIFAFGLTLAACGRLHARGVGLDADAICAEVAAMCKGLVARELRHAPVPTHGGAAFRAHGFPGARGEAEAGYPLVRRLALPALRDALARGSDRDHALRVALVALLTQAADTNLLSRGGVDAIAYVRDAARAIPADLPRADLVAGLRNLDAAFTARRLSPGGSADLIALTWFLHRLDGLRRDASFAAVEPARAPALSCLSDHA